MSPFIRFSSKKMLGLLFAFSEARRRQISPLRNANGYDILSVARSKIGCPYVWGANGPNTFDCSGLVQYAHKMCGITVPRVSYQQAAGGKPGNGAAGDVCCFHSPVSHVGICCGDGNFIHAPQPGEVVKVASLSRRRDLTTIRRYW